MNKEKIAHLDAVSRKARTVMEREGLDALVVTVCDNFYYLTGFASFFMYTFRHTGAAVAIMFRDESIPSQIIMNEFEAASTHFDMPNMALKTFPVWVDVDDPRNPLNHQKKRERPIGPPIEAVFGLVKDALESAGVLDKTIAIELQAMSNGGKSVLDKVAPGLKLVDSTALFNEIRMIKSPWEIQHLRKSAEITEFGIASAAKHIRVGCTATELTAAFKAAVMTFPETNFSRFNLISVGDNFSPKMFPDETPAKPGDLIKFDCGVDVAGYGADLARTFVLGEPDELTQQIYNTIRIGHEHMLSMVAPGVKLKDVFDSTMDVIKKSGLPHYNRGHLGHGDGVFLGLEEAPFVSTLATETFRPGMVLSLETPYYGIGMGSIMLEDMILITNDGYEFLSKLDRDLRRYN
ncbi:M24 family metallopeptidase [Yersinia enterocolitica]|uniref:M24 family metallopeptidase n=1 Tax=Yersinia enterocolitica TaxID=630 RepID=UPI000657F9CB|nr:M24 family metallopeptidase [Yersinia enterocolitica]EKN3847948.1 M24 family metallopeptidase [Yersinia enterocolitica]EKN4750302.1 M24 family metallopeptidase [Yersinia enterocolitica]EKN6358906.1 M24 family metallopeptidase [Yersinia enterocolitica]EKN6405882.1 M24 family metallopeptidase [Yersinia enterocolitica]ELI8069627.1 M24 family metallopeptidase [Yersinia enterocolitica]